MLPRRVTPFSARCVQSFDRLKVKKVSFAQALRALNSLCKIELTAGETELLKEYTTTDGQFRYKDFAEDIDRGAVTPCEFAPWPCCVGGAL